MNGEIESLQNKLVSAAYRNQELENRNRELEDLLEENPLVQQVKEMQKTFDKFCVETDELIKLLENQLLAEQGRNETLLEILRQIRERGFFKSDWTGECSALLCKESKPCVHMVARDVLKMSK